MSSLVCNISKMKKCHVVLTTIFTFLLVIFTTEAGPTGSPNLRNNFYAKRCPQAELVVGTVMAKAFVKDPTIAAGLIRIFFHDCFVTGCDASLLLDSTPSGERVEKISSANGNGLNGLNGLPVVDEIKSRLEKECPGTVSCSDILSYAAREAVFLSGLPYYQVHGGRRDGPASVVTEVFKNLPFPTMSVDDMLKLYERKGFTAEDLVVLAGAHSIGDVHCKMFDHRLYLNLTNPRVPPIDPPYAALLKTKCPAPSLGNVKQRDAAMVKFDPETPLVLDNAFYRSLEKGRGLLQSDQILLSDPRTSRTVHLMAANRDAWGRRFVLAMGKLGKLDVLTGNSGVIRKNCRVP